MVRQQRAALQSVAASAVILLACVAAAPAGAQALARYGEVQVDLPVSQDVRSADLLLRMVDREAKPLALAAAGAEPRIRVRLEYHVDPQAQELTVRSRVGLWRAGETLPTHGSSSLYRRQLQPGADVEEGLRTQLRQALESTLLLVAMERTRARR